MGDGDAKRNIKEHIFISTAVFFISLFFDHLVNLLNAINIHLVRGEVGSHPYEIGHLQIVLMVVSVIHFCRKVNEYRFYGSLIPDFLKKEL